MIVDTVLAKVFGTRNEREIKVMLPAVAAVGELEPAMRAAVGYRSGRQNHRIQGTNRPRRVARRPAGGSLRGGPRGRPPRPQHAPFRRPVDRRHGAAQGQNRRNEDRRRQDAGRHPALLPQRARRQGRPRRHGQRLPGQTRLRMDGPPVQIPGPAGGRDRPRPGRRGAQGSLRLRHHLRHQQRVRLRLPARQHEVPHRGLRAARRTTTPSSTKWTPS